MTPLDYFFFFLGILGVFMSGIDAKRFWEDWYLPYLVSSLGCLMVGTSLALVVALNL